MRLILRHNDVLGRHGRDGLVVKVEPARAVWAGDSDCVVASGRRVAVMIDDAEEAVLDRLLRALGRRDDLCNELVRIEENGMRDRPTVGDDELSAVRDGL